MKKVRVLKEMPGISIGTEIPIRDNEAYGFGGKSDYLKITINPTAHSTAFHSSTSFEKLISDGWLEWVEEEKSLKQKVRDSLEGKFQERVALDGGWYDDLAQIATDHFKKGFEKSLLMDICWDKQEPVKSTINHIRRVMFGEDND